jgi:hypothetical protein
MNRTEGFFQQDKDRYGMVLRGCKSRQQRHLILTDIRTKVTSFLLLIATDAGFAAATLTGLPLLV